MNGKPTLRHYWSVLKNIVAVLVVLVGSSTFESAPVFAHEVQPAIVDLSFSEDGRYRLEISLNLEAIVAQIGPDHTDTSQSENATEYDRLRALEPDILAEVFAQFTPDFIAGMALVADGRGLNPSVEDVQIPQIGDLDLARDSIIVLGGLLPLNATTFVWEWKREFGTSVIRIRGETPEQTYSAYLVEGQASDPLPVSGVKEQGLVKIVLNYIVIGYTHIIPKGLDHILFVVGLYLLSTRLHPLLWQVTAFTVAHTISLAMGMAGWVNVPPGIVEPLIALSITYVCVENLFVRDLTRWRPFVVFGFGLLHGLGFARVLREIGLAPGQFVTGLISFNVGVELGQLSIIALCFATVGIWFGKASWYRVAIVIPASLVIGTIGGWWFIERAFLA